MQWKELSNIYVTKVLMESFGEDELNRIFDEDEDLKSRLDSLITQVQIILNELSKKDKLYASTKMIHEYIFDVIKDKNDVYDPLNKFFDEDDVLNNYLIDVNLDTEEIVNILSKRDHQFDINEIHEFIFDEIRNQTELSEPNNKYQD